ncbi:MAG: Uma2 family endonuclease [Blastocatellia bacterium]
MTSTAELALDQDLEYEIIDGRKEAKMAGARHGEICAQIIIELGLYLRKTRAGRIYTPDTTFQIGVYDRLPDVSVIIAARIPEEGAPASKWEIAPDLAIEIISPNDAWEKVKEKVRDYFAAGVRQVWLVSQKDRDVTVYDSPTLIKVFTENDELTTETILPGFKCRVGDLFDV